MANIKKPVAPILDESGNLHRDWADRFQKTFDAVSGPSPMAQFKLATLPDPAKYIYHHNVIVTDATGGPAPCYSNGTNWLRVKNDVIVA